MQKSLQVQGLAIIAACMFAAGGAAADSKPKSKPTPNPTSADCKAIADEGRTKFSNGNFGDALTSFETAMSCDPKQDLVQLAAIAACRAQNKEKALLWGARVTHAKYTAVTQACAQAGIELPPRPAPAPVKTK